MDIYKHLQIDNTFISRTVKSYYHGLAANVIFIYYRYFKDLLICLHKHFRTRAILIIDDDTSSKYLNLDIFFKEFILFIIYISFFF